MSTRLQVRQDAQKKIKSWIEEVVADNRARDFKFPLMLNTKPIAIAVDSEVASGKTHILTNTIKEERLSALVFVEQTETANMIADAIDGIAIHSNMHGKYRGMGVNEILELILVTPEYKRVVMTHAMLKKLLDGDGYQHVFSHFELIAVDESFKSHDMLSKGMSAVAGILAPLAVLNTPEADIIMGYIKSLLKLSEKHENKVQLIDASALSLIDIEELINQLENMEDTSGIFSSKELIPTNNFLSHLKHHNDKVLYLEKSGNTAHFVVVRNFFPENRSIIILADGCSKDGSMIALQKYHKDVDVKIERLNRGDWSNYEVHYEFGNTGKASTSDISENQLNCSGQVNLARVLEFSQ